MGLKPRDVTYIGVHSRMTDSTEFVDRQWYEEPLREDFFTVSKEELSDIPGL